MKKLGKFIKSNTKLFIGFILGTIIFGSVGAVVAGTVASSEITYTNNGQTTVQGALNDLYGKANSFDNIINMYKNISGMDFKFWNDNFNNNSYGDFGYNNGTPDTLYSNYTSIVTPGEDNVFVRVKYINGNNELQEPCLYLGSTDKIFCINRELGNFEDQMKESLGTNVTCDTDNPNGEYTLVCSVGTSYCYNFDDWGEWGCYANGRECKVNSLGCFYTDYYILD